MPISRPYKPRCLAGRTRQKRRKQDKAVSPKAARPLSLHIRGRWLRVLSSLAASLSRSSSCCNCTSCIHHTSHPTAGRSSETSFASTSEVQPKEFVCSLYHTLYISLSHELNNERVIVCPTPSSRSRVFIKLRPPEYTACLLYDRDQGLLDICFIIEITLSYTLPHLFGTITISHRSETATRYHQSPSGSQEARTRNGRYHFISRCVIIPSQSCVPANWGRLLMMHPEHTPTYTTGRRDNSPNPDTLHPEEKKVQNVGAEFHITKRGGQVTYHGPGQLVGYPIMDLNRMDVSLLLSWSTKWIP